MSAVRPSQLTLLESSIKALASTVLFPFGFSTVKTNTERIVYRFGKYDRTYQSGFQWMSPIGVNYDIFKGLHSTELKDLNLLDKQGTPIIVNSIINTRIQDSCRYLETTNYLNDRAIINGKLQASLRNTLSNYPFISTEGLDIRKGGSELSREISAEMNRVVEENGIVVETATISEAKYSPEVAQQMLVKQQAQAYVEARAIVVRGAVETVREIISEMPNLSPAMRDKITANLITILAGQNSAQPVIKM